MGDVGSFAECLPGSPQLETTESSNTVQMGSQSRFKHDHTLTVSKPQEIVKGILAGISIGPHKGGNPEVHAAALAPSPQRLTLEIKLCKRLSTTGV